MPNKVALHASNRMPTARTTEEIAELQSSLWSGSGGAIRLILSSWDDRAYYVADALERFDRELRRSATRDSHGERLVLESAIGYEPIDYQKLGSSTPSRRSVPAEPSTASLRLIGADRGSVNLYLEPVEQMFNLLASQGVIATVNALAISGSVNRLRIFFARRVPWRSERGPSAADVEAVVTTGSDATFVFPDMSIRFDDRRLRRVIVLQRRANGDSNFIVADYDES